jgi:hypothetical protein
MAVLTILVKETHQGHRLLRARRERPHRRRAPEKRDELAPSQLIELHSIPASQGRIAGYRIGEDQSAGIGATVQPVFSPMSESVRRCLLHVRIAHESGHGRAIDERRCPNYLPPACR